MGLFVGSFLNVVIFRFPELKGILVGRSKCPKCKKTINAFDLVPILSYIILWGKCRYCRKPISLQYPVVELATGIIFFLLARAFGLNYQLVLYLLIACVSLLIFIYDTKYLEIPEVLAWLLLFFTIVTAFFQPNFAISNFLLGGLIGGGILGILVGISDERLMGSGDIKIGLAFGFLLGMQKSLLFLFLSFIIGAVVGLVLIIMNRKKMKSEIAFAPFLITAAIISILWGDYLVNLYLKFAIM